MVLYCKILKKRKNINKIVKGSYWNYFQFIEKQKGQFLAMLVGNLDISLLGIFFTTERTKEQTKYLKKTSKKVIRAQKNLKWKSVP